MILMLSHKQVRGWVRGLGRTGPRTIHPSLRSYDSGLVLLPSPRVGGSGGGWETTVHRRSVLLRVLRRNTPSTETRVRLTDPVRTGRHGRDLRSLRSSASLLGGAGWGGPGPRSARGPLWTRPVRRSPQWVLGTSDTDPLSFESRLRTDSQGLIIPDTPWDPGGPVANLVESDGTLRIVSRDQDPLYSFFSCRNGYRHYDLQR